MEKKVSYWIKKLLLLASQYYNTELKLKKITVFYLLPK